MQPPTLEQTLATRALDAGTRNVSKALTEFEKWLVAGYGAIFALSIPKLAELAVVIEKGHLVLALALLCAALVISVFALFLGAQIAAATGAGEELAKALPELVPKGSTIDLDSLQREVLRGLWWPGSAGARFARKRQDIGDWVGPARMTAKLSQIQAYIVLFQLLLGLAAAIVVVTGITLP